jgi:hypothetical protein
MDRMDLKTDGLDAAEGAFGWDRDIWPNGERDLGGPTHRVPFAYVGDPDAREIALGGGQQILAPADAFGGEIRIAANDRAFAGELGTVGAGHA